MINYLCNKNCYKEIKYHLIINEFSYNKIFGILRIKNDLNLFKVILGYLSHHA